MKYLQLKNNNKSRFLIHATVSADGAQQSPLSRTQGNQYLENCQFAVEKEKNNKTEQNPKLGGHTWAIECSNFEMTYCFYLQVIGQSYSCPPPLQLHQEKTGNQNPAKFPEERRTENNWQKALTTTPSPKTHHSYFLVHIYSVQPS